MRKILVWIAALVIVAAIALWVYWYTEPDVWIEPTKVVVASQLDGDAISLDIPAETYAEYLGNYEFRLQLQGRNDELLKETDTVKYRRNIQYKFVTDSGLPIGSYTARIVVGYQLNPVAYRELEFPLAIIYVHGRTNDNSGAAVPILRQE